MPRPPKSRYKGAQDHSAKAPPIELQRKVDAHFTDRSGAWKDVYGGTDTWAVIHQERLKQALGWVDRLNPRPDPSALDVGCGAGLAAVALAKRGFQVKAMDPVPDMVELTRRSAEETGVAGRVTASLGDAHELRFESDAFDVVLALGVFPFLANPVRAATEMARVLRPGGHLIANVDNKLRIIRFLDPPQAVPPAVRRALKRSLERVSLRRPTGEGLPVRMHRPAEFDRLLEAAGLDNIASRQIGFGPFTFLRRPMLTDRTGLKVHAFLQGLADRELPPIRSMGAQYMVLARKSPQFDR